MAAIGWGVIGFGTLGLFHSAERTHPEVWIRWFIGAALVHDFIVAPTVFGVGALVLIHVRAPYRSIIQGAMITSGVIVLTTWPFLRGYGRRPDNISVLPNNYAFGLLIVLGIVWAVTLPFVMRARKSR